MTLRVLQNALLPFPVRRVYCVGRNYAEHRAEMGDSDRELPFFFQKPHDAVFQSDQLKYPRNTTQLSYEAELVVVMKDNKTIFGYALGIDLTKRDVQSVAKQKGRPWDSSKSFDNSALIGEIVPASSIRGTLEGNLSLSLNGVMKQTAQLSDMIWSVPELLLQLELNDFSLKQGDLIFTGTPAGVGTLAVGDACIVTLRHSDSGEDVLPPLGFEIIQQ